MKQRIRFVLLMILLLLFVPAHAIQQSQFRSNTLGVRVDVRVTDGRRPVPGLTASDFDLRDNGVAQSVTIVDAADVPLNVVLALDTSASTDGARQADLIAASEALLDGLKPVDRVALTSFSHAVVPRLALTGDLPRVRSEVRGMTAAGRTAIMDAAYVALTATLGQPGRSLVVLCTDGSDISSWLRPVDALDAARRSNAVVYAVTSAEARRAPSLEEITEATGGDLLRVSSGKDLRQAFRDILEDFRASYILAYTPTGVSSEGFHRLDVRVKRRGLRVTARPGYIGLDRPR